MGLTQIVTPRPRFMVRDVGPVCLIIPPSGFLMDERVFPPLGIARIGSVLECANVKVEMLDFAGVRNFTDAIEDHCRRSDTSCFGITITTPQLPAATQIAETIRAVRPDAKIILGGPHVTSVNTAARSELKEFRDGRAMVAMRQLKSNFHCLVAGDGEKAIFDACSPNSPEIIDADDPKSPYFLTNKDLNELPFPARHLIDMSSYHYFIDGERAHSLIAQLGCPFECSFCGLRNSPSFRRVRTRTKECILTEMIHIYATYGVKGFMMYDDELNVNREMVALMRLIANFQKEIGVEWRLRGFIKAELFNEEQAEAMYKAGFRWILTGFESGSPEILRTIRKKATREDNTRCVEIAHKHGLKVKALMSIGHPGETLKTIEETQKWLLDARPDDFDATIITCYPGTPYYDQAVPFPGKSGVWEYTCDKTGAQLYQLEVDYTRTADYYKGDINGGYKAYVFTKELSCDDLVNLRGELETSVRQKLGIPFNQGAPGIQYEHSMGQMGPLPSNILRVSAGTRVP